MSFQGVQQSKTQNPQTSSSTSRFAPRSFSIPEPQRPQTQEEIENEAFEQDKFEATGLQLKEKYGTIAPAEQGRLGILQAKMDSFWIQRMERATPQPNLLEIMIRNAQTTSAKESAAVQSKLTIGQPNDQYEQEADRVAAQVMAMPNPTAQVQRQPQNPAPEELSEKAPALQSKPIAASITPLVQRQELPEEEESVQRVADGVPQVQPDLESRLSTSQSGGSPLPDDVRGFMEPRFGADFSQVRVHTGSDAVQMNQELGAQAFTHGSHIYYGAGKAPATDELTGHELTHVVQQINSKQLIQKTPEQDERVDEREQLLVMSEIQRRSLYSFYATEGLIDIAGALDAELMSGTLSPRMTMERARTLLSIYRTLQVRVQSSADIHPDDSSFSQQSVSGFPHEQEESARGSEPTSPLGGLIEDIPPFGNIDLWIALARRPTSEISRRQRRSQTIAQVEPVPSLSTDTDGNPSDFSVEGQGNREADSATHQIRQEARLPESVGNGPSTPDILDFTISLITEIVDDVLLSGLTAPISAILNGASVVGTMEQSEQTRRAEARAVAVQLAVRALGLIHPPPRLLSKAILEQYCRGTADWTLKIHENLYPLGPEATERAMRSGLTSVALIVNEAVRRSERRASIEIQRSLTESEAQQLREVVYERIQANLRIPN